MLSNTSYSDLCLHFTSMVDTPIMPSKRRPKFTSDELEALVDSVDQYQQIIYSKCADCITNNKKTRAWRSVTDSVNTVSVVLRKPDEIRRKWRDWTSIIKCKEQKRRRIQNRTGGEGHMIVMAPLEEKVVELLGETVLEGISTGSDPSTPSTSEDGPTRPTRPACCTVTARNGPTRPACCTVTARNVSQSRSRSHSPGRKSPSNHSSRSLSPVKPFVSNDRKSAEASSRQVGPVPDDPAVQLVNIERERLTVDQQRLAVQKERLDVEKRRLTIEERKMAVIEMLIYAKKGGGQSDSDVLSSCLL